MLGSRKWCPLPSLLTNFSFSMLSFISTKEKITMGCVALSLISVHLGVTLPLPEAQPFTEQHCCSWDHKCPSKDRVLKICTQGGTIGKWYILQEEGPSEKRLGHWSPCPCRVLWNPCPFLSFLLPSQQTSSFAPMCPPSMMFFVTSPKINRASPTKSN